MSAAKEFSMATTPIPDTSGVPSNLAQEFERVLHAALRLAGDKGNVQLFRLTDSSLQIVAQRGFDREFREFFSGTHPAGLSPHSAVRALTGGGDWKSVVWGK